MQRSAGRMQRSRSNKTLFLAKKPDILSGFASRMVPKHPHFYPKQVKLGQKPMFFEICYEEYAQSNVADQKSYVEYKKSLTKCQAFLRALLL